MKPIKLSDLNEDQKGHFAWRLDHKTVIGLVTACTIARGGHGDVVLADVFEWGGKSKQSAKIHARKCLNYSLEEAQRKLLEKPTQPVTGEKG